MDEQKTAAAPRCTEEQLVREVHNAARAPYHAMSEAASGVLDVHWRAVEWWSRDACAWVQNPCRERPTRFSRSF